jgi:hypothetical protein
MTGGAFTGISRQHRFGTRATLPLVVPTVVTGFLWLTSRNNLSSTQVFAAFILLLIPWLSYLNWRTKRTSLIPLFSAVSGLYWLYFAVPLFWDDRLVWTWRAQFSVSDEAVTQTLLLTILGVCSLWLGLHSGIVGHFVSKRLPDISPDPRHWNYLRIVLVAGTVLSIYESPTYSFGEGGRNFIIILQSTVPLAAFALLYRNYLRGTAAPIDQALALVFLAVRVVVGLSSGWTGSLLWVGITCLLIYVQERRRAPVPFLLAFAFYVLFVDVGKNDFRQIYWYSDVSANRLDRMRFWLDRSASLWAEALRDSSGNMILQISTHAIMRTSLLKQAAQVLEATPSIVPYQHGKLYSYIAVSWIPRFLWPDKPSVNEANQFYQLAYDINRPQDLGQISIAIGSMTEAYISFGWVGVAVIMFLEGLVFALFERMFFSLSSGPLMWSIGIVVTLDLLLIECQMAQYLGGIFQKAILTFLIFLPILRVSGRLRHQDPVRRPQIRGTVEHARMRIQI